MSRDEVEEEVLVLNGDVLFHPVIARALVRRPRSSLAYDSRSGRGEEETKVIVRGGGLSATPPRAPRPVSGRVAAVAA